MEPLHFLRGLFFIHKKNDGTPSIIFIAAIKFLVGNFYF